MQKIDFDWFKRELAPILKNYDITYRFYEEGDFGSLNQVEFNSIEKGGEIDFWGLGRLEIFVWDYEKEKELLNVLLDPCQEEEKEKVFKRLQELL